MPLDLRNTLSTSELSTFMGEAACMFSTMTVILWIQWIKSWSGECSATGDRCDRMRWWRGRLPYETDLARHCIISKELCAFCECLPRERCFQFLLIPSYCNSKRHYFLDRCKIFLWFGANYVPGLVLPLVFPTTACCIASLWPTPRLRGAIMWPHFWKGKCWGSTDERMNTPSSDITVLGSFHPWWRNTI